MGALMELEIAIHPALVFTILHPAMMSVDERKVLVLI
jgi:hypothetical protein